MTAAARLPLTVQMSLLFAAVIALTVAAVSGLMYVELVRDLRDKEGAELRRNLDVQARIMAAAAAHRLPDYWQREWQESRNAYGRFAWQALSADGAVRDASSNWPAFAGALERDGRRQAWAPRSAARPGAPEHVLLETMRIARPAGGGTLRGALDISADMRIVSDYRVYLGVLGVLAIVPAFGLAWSVARHGLAPLRAFGASAARGDARSARALRRGRPLPEELVPLAATFDDLREQVSRSSRRLSSVSAEVASELSVPIENMMTASSVMLSRSRSADEYQHALEVVVDEGTRLSRLLADMLFLVRADNGEQAPRREALSLASEFRRLVDFFEVSFEERGALLRHAGACQVDADASLLRRALSTLLTHVLCLAGAGVSVRLSCETRQDAVLVALEAAGAALAPAPAAVLVDRLRPAGDAGASLASAGIELAVVRAIMELHGGTVDSTFDARAGLRIALGFPLRRCDA